ncbi:MAG: hypothetical protein AAF808_21510, partial [Cyanobacteria bacterium P01_D01_bin.2]
DSDDDGLNDNVELFELGTLPTEADTDGDNLPDGLEVKGITEDDGSRWYLNPLSGNSGYNPEPDGSACADQNGVLVCLDSDNDDVPNVYDLDNDNDGVPDGVDSSPNTVIGSPAGLDNKTFQFELENISANEPVYVDFQLRPTNPDHLWYSLSTLDWPENDQDGQVHSMLDTPYKDGEPGDMRLVPMLEIEISGNTTPLPLTTAQTNVSLSGDITGTISLTQQGNDVAVHATLDHTGVNHLFFYDTACGETASNATPVGTLEFVSDGGNYQLSDVNLAQNLGDGNHSLVVYKVSANRFSCHPIPKILTGPHTDQMIDLEALETYGISIRESGENDGLLAYVPLVLTHELEGNSPVAFSGRMFYRAGQNDFGDVETARLAWLVMTRTDQCLPMPDGFDPDPDREDETDAERAEAWCHDPANWANSGTTPVHVYYDDWRLTGLTVKRNLGLESAVVFEDPVYTAANAADLNGFTDDNLWALARGLDSTFIAGRTSSGNRD